MKMLTLNQFRVMISILILGLSSHILYIGIKEMLLVHDTIDVSGSEHDRRRNEWNQIMMQHQQQEQQQQSEKPEKPEKPEQVVIETMKEESKETKNLRIEETKTTTTTQPRPTFTHKPLIHSSILGIDYSPGLTTKEIGPLCSDSLGMKKYRCDPPNEYCDLENCSHSSVFQLVPGKSEASTVSFKREMEHIRNYFEGTEERLVRLNEQLAKYHKERSIEKFQRPLFVMFVNYGYVYQFFNWLCSCEKNGISGIRDDIIVLITDDLAEKLLQKQNIFTMNVQESGSWMKNTHYDVAAAKKFGLGAHAKINTQSISLLTDMIQLGYDVFVMDADLVWKSDPRPEMIRRAEENHYDGLFLSDGRSWGYSFNNQGLMPQFRGKEEFDHPYTTHNTGFFLIRSSPSMKEFTSSLMRGLHLIIWKGTDQMWWNTLLFHKKFSHLKFGVMPEDKYLPGSKISTSGVLKTNNQPFPRDDFIVAHMSDANSHLKKITKFYLCGQWYLTEECSLYKPCLEVSDDSKSPYGCLPANYKLYFDINAPIPTAFGR